MKKSKAQEPEIPVLLMQEGTPFVPDTSRSGEYRSHLNEHDSWLVNFGDPQFMKYLIENYG